MNRLAIMAIGSTLVIPAVGTLNSAEAAPSAAFAHSCVKERHGTTVRIGIVFESGKKTRVRVSHPDGHGPFKNARVKQAQSAVHYANAIDAARYRPSFRVDNGMTKVMTVFKLKNGKQIKLTCR